MRKAAIPMLAALLLALPGLADANKAHKAVRPAVQACKQERSADPAAFKAKYANTHGKHAFRRCVHQHESDPVS